MNRGENVFSPVIPSEKEKILFSLSKSRHPIFCQAEDKSTFELKCLGSALGEFEVAPIKGDVTLGPIIMNFNVNAETFFMKSTISKKRERYFVDPEPSLYKLQRRENFRLKFPKGYDAHVEITQIDRTKLKSKHSVFDLSGGGLAFESHSMDRQILQQKSEVHGLLTVGSDYSQDFVGEIRYHRPNVENSHSWIVGIQFSGMSQKEQARLVDFVMKIHRQLFAKI